VTAGSHCAVDTSARSRGAASASTARSHNGCRRSPPAICRTRFASSGCSSTAPIRHTSSSPAATNSCQFSGPRSNQVTSS